MSAGKKVTLVITGGIAAYKLCEVTSSLSKAGVSVTCVLTEAALTMVSPLVLKTLSGNRVYTDREYFDAGGEYEKVPHIRLAQDTDLVVIAPATANTIAKYSCGISDNLASSILLASDKPVLVFPAMNDVMYKSPATQANIAKITEYGAIVITPDTGYLACRTQGPGRLPDAEVIISYIYRELNDTKDLKGRKVLINAGGTSEDIDAARCITNRSSGKTGISLATEAFRRGAEVVLVTASQDEYNMPYIDIRRARTSDEMAKHMREEYDDSDIVIFSAAVSDFKPEIAYGGKLKKADSLELRLVRNIDIAEQFGRMKGKDKIHIGFCAETEALEHNAAKKLAAKHFDLIFANDISKPGDVFGSDTNRGLLIDRNGRSTDVPHSSKDAIARIIFDAIAGLHGGTENLK